MEQLKVFISYSSEDSLLAGVFKKCFETYAGFSVFLAHEDLSPASEWEVEIINKLKDCNIIVPLITKNYRNSEFTDQELGMAIAWKKIIFPIKLTNINPYGFVKKFQALKCQNNETSVIDAVISIVLVLIEKKEFNKHKMSTTDSVVKAFSKSTSFNMTRAVIRILTKVNDFSKEQLSILKIAVEKNPQINKEYYALPDFKKLLQKKYKTIIDI